MERMISLPRRAADHLMWMAYSIWMRCARAIGLGGLATVGAGLLLALLLGALHWTGVERARLARLQQGAARPAPGLPAPETGFAREDFRRVLTPHDDIPQVIARLFELAATQQITLARGEYRMQMDEAGGFLRYRISLPVKGQAAAIQGFIEQGLLNHRSLAFESVQFKRDKIESANVEARIQWTLFAQPKAAP